MPEVREAVIVDSVRTPIGRAGKGSLREQRPDEMAAFIIDALLERSPALDPVEVEEVYLGCGLPQGLQANNIARIAVLLSKHLTIGTGGVDHQPLLRLVAAGDPDRGQQRGCRAGRRLRRRRGRVRLQLQRGGRGAPVLETRTLTCTATSRRCPMPTSRWD